jgi:hypothetical protein
MPDGSIQCQEYVFNPEANKIITDVTEKAKTIPNVKDKIAFLKQEKQKFDAKFSALAKLEALCLTVTDVEAAFGLTK